MSSALGFSRESPHQGASFLQCRTNDNRWLGKQLNTTRNCCVRESDVEKSLTGNVLDDSEKKRWFGTINTSSNTSNIKNQLIGIFWLCFDLNKLTQQSKQMYKINSNNWKQVTASYTHELIPTGSKFSSDDLQVFRREAGTYGCYQHTAEMAYQLPGDYQIWQQMAAKINKWLEKLPHGKRGEGCSSDRAKAEEGHGHWL